MRKGLLALITLLLTGWASVAQAQITPIFTFSDGTVISADDVNTNFALFSSALNRTGGTMTGTLTSRQITPSASDTYDLGTAAALFRTGYLRTSLVLGQSTANYTLTWADPASARAISIPDPGGTDTFVFAAASQALTNKTLNGFTFNQSVASGASPTFTGTNFTGIPEAGITDGSILARLAADETISGTWTFSNALTVGANITNSQTLAGMSYNRILNQSTNAAAYAAHIVNASGNSWAMRMGSSAANDNALEFAVDALGTPVVKLAVSTAGAVTVTGHINSASLQPGFEAYRSGDTSFSDGQTITFDTEVDDTGGNFAASTFTAPVDGRYLFCATVQLTSASSGQSFGINLVTTGGTKRLAVSPAITGVTYTATIGNCAIVLMDATDTARITLAAAGTNATAGSGSSPMVSHFTGRLLP